MEVMNVVKKFHKKIDFDAHTSCVIKYPTAVNCIECCSKPYFDQVKIDYTCPQKRKIYVARYAPAFISEVCNALTMTTVESFEEIFQKTQISVASIGGGPGTDVAAFKMWLSNNIEQVHEVNNVRFLRVDINKDWDDVSGEIINLYSTSGIKFEYKKIVRDITKETIDAKSFEHFDVIILSYIISEIDFKDIKNVAKNISALISNKALVIVNDRPQQDVIEKINALVNEIGGKKPRIRKPSENDHCGETYPNEIFTDVGATIFRKSIRYNVLVEN